MSWSYNFQLLSKKILIILSLIILLITLLELVFIGKNFTFSTRFTPPESLQNSFRNQSYITEAQALIIFFSILYIAILPISIYSTFEKSKKIFIPNLLAFNIVSGLLIFLNLYFLTGASQYRNFMDDEYVNFISNGNICDGDSSLCIVGTCVRLEIFKQANAMAISFTVINSVLSLALTGLAVYLNRKRKNNQILELIV